MQFQNRCSLSASLPRLDPHPTKAFGLEVLDIFTEAEVGEKALRVTGFCGWLF